MIYQIGSNFSGFDLNAKLDDSRMGMKHLSAWERVASVSNHETINTFAKFFGYMLSCELHIFKNSELDETKKWITEN